MIRQCLSNTNENAIVVKIKFFLELNKTLVTSQNPFFFKISCHIKSFNICIKH